MEDTVVATVVDTEVDGPVVMVADGIATVAATVVDMEAVADGIPVDTVVDGTPVDGVVPEAAGVPGNDSPSHLIY